MMRSLLPLAAAALLCPAVGDRQASHHPVKKQIRWYFSGPSKGMDSPGHESHSD
jgi:hypothetical protein